MPENANWTLSVPESTSLLSGGPLRSKPLDSLQFRTSVGRQEPLRWTRLEVEYFIQLQPQRVKLHL